MLELVVDPPSGGDHVADLVSRLAVEVSAIEAAAATLQRAGLLWRIGRRMAPSPAALAFVRVRSWPGPPQRLARFWVCCSEHYPAHLSTAEIVLDTAGGSLAAAALWQERTAPPHVRVR